MLTIFEYGNSQLKINAPQFIYHIIHPSKPIPNFYGRGCDHQQVMINGIGIDKAIPKTSIDKLNTIDDIEMRSSCQGSDSDHPTFIIFRPLNQSESFVKTLVKKINNSSGYCAGYDLGFGGKFRIGVTSSDAVFHPSPEFDKWWKNIYSIIFNALK